MSWDTWGRGTRVVVCVKDHTKFGSVGTIEGHNPLVNKFQVVLEDGEILSMEPENLIEFNKDSSIKLTQEVVEKTQDSVKEDDSKPFETASETLLRLACREDGATLNQLCEERGSTVKGPFQRCINANIKKGLVVERGNGVFFTTGSAMREKLKNKQALPIAMLGQKEYVTKEELALIFERMAKMLR